MATAYQKFEITGPASAQAALPGAARKVLEQLSAESSTISVWLVGSQANSSATPASDWDFLVFSTAEPIPINSRCQEVDVIQVGPSGMYLLEGQGPELRLPFEKWYWQLVDEDSAIYLGMDTSEEALEGVSREPTRATKQRAFQLWRKGQKRLDTHDT